jgi:hypothetical protein
MPQLAYLDWNEHLATIDPSDTTYGGLPKSRTGIQYMARLHGKPLPRPVAPAAPKPATPAPVAKPKPTEAQLRASEGAEYVRLFGAERGSQWFAEGKTINDCTRIIGREEIERREASKSDAKKVTEGVNAYFASKRTTPTKPGEPAKSKPAPLDLSNPLEPGARRFASGLVFRAPKPATFPDGK